MSRTKQEKNKALVLEAFDTLFNKRDYVDYVAAERCGARASITNAPTFVGPSIGSTAGSGDGFGHIGISIGATLAGRSCLCPSFTASTSLFECST